MKKLLLVPALMLAFFFSTISSVSAADVWVDHWNDNVDAYVVEETLSGNNENFSVVVKKVRNGRLIEQSTYYYFRGRDIWGVKINGHKYLVDGNPNRLFEYCADSLRIYYHTDGHYYY